MNVSTPELLWHGGGAENGKPDPVFSVDIFDKDILATAGVDENIPPKGSMRVSLQLQPCVFFTYKVYSFSVLLISCGRLVNQMPILNSWLI